MYLPDTNLAQARGHDQILLPGLRGPVVVPAGHLVARCRSCAPTEFTNRFKILKSSCQVQGYTPQNRGFSLLAVTSSLHREGSSHVQLRHPPCARSDIGLTPQAPTVRASALQPLRRMALLSNINSQLTVAREHALLGEYSNALVYFEGVISQIDRYTVFQPEACSL